MAPFLERLIYYKLYSKQSVATTKKCIELLTSKKWSRQEIITIVRQINETNQLQNQNKSRKLSYEFFQNDSILTTSIDIIELLRLCIHSYQTHVFPHIQLPNKDTDYYLGLTHCLVEQSLYAISDHYELNPDKSISIFPSPTRLSVITMKMDEILDHICLCMLCPKSTDNKVPINDHVSITKNNDHTDSLHILETRVSKIEEWIAEVQENQEEVEESIIEEEQDEEEVKEQSDIVEGKPHRKDGF